MFSVIPYSVTLRSHGSMTKWLTVEEIARHLRTVPSTVYKLKERGRIRGYRVGRQLLFDADEVDEDIKSGRRKKPTPTTFIATRPVSHRSSLAKQYEPSRNQAMSYSTHSWEAAPVW